MADLTPNITGLLRRWGVLTENLGAVEVTKLVSRFSNGDGNAIVDLGGSPELWQHAWELVKGVRLYQQFRDIVNNDSRHAHSITLHQSATLPSVDPETGRVILADRTLIDVDVVITADGIHVSGIWFLIALFAANKRVHVVQSARGD